MLFHAIPLTYYHHPDVLFLAQNLLGKYLFTRFDELLTGGIIIETEAYAGINDQGSHSYGGKKTKRNAAMFHEGGISYVYFCYGLHALFNIVTNVGDIPQAVLVRAIKPEIGLETMLKRRNKTKLDKTLTSGPGSLTEALGIKVSHNGLSLDQPPIWLEDRGLVIDESQILTGPRVGIDYAQEDALLPWRFRIKL